MVIVDPKDVDLAKTRVIGWTLSMLAIVAVEIEIANWLQ